MAKFKVVLERTDTITKQAEIVIEANSAVEALQQIAYDLDSDPGAYDSDLQPIEDGEGEITIKVESQYEQFPSRGGWTSLRAAISSSRMRQASQSVTCMRARMKLCAAATHAEAAVIAEAITRLPDLTAR
jgi:hypothetical protein